MTCIAAEALPGTIRVIQGARYCSHGTSTLKSLSSPNAIGATVKPNRSGR